MSVSTYLPRSTTWETLQKSRNLAAIATLSTGLASSRAELRHLSIKSLLARAEPQSRRAIILHWDNYNDADRELLRLHSHRFIEPVQAILADGSLHDKRLAIAAIAELDLCDAIDAILDMVVEPKHPLCQKATRCLMEMCERWGGRARTGSDFLTVRRRMLEKLSARLVFFQKHKNLKLADAWICLAHWDDSLQRRLITNPRHGAYLGFMNRLRESDHPAALKLLSGYLFRTTTPKNIIAILTERTDSALAVEIAKSLDSGALNHSLKRLRQLPAFQCLDNIESELPSMGVDIQRRLWLMIAASSDDLGQVLRGALKLSKLGTQEARQTAAAMLRDCRRPEIDTLISAVQAAAFETLPESAGLGDMINELATWLQGPSVVLEKAAREFLQDFTFDNLLDRVRHWPTQMCKDMARLTALMETDITSKLKVELQNPAPRRRLAALQVTQLLGCADDVRHALMPLLEDPRVEIRVRMIDLLASLGDKYLEQRIPSLLEDASTDIQDAAGRAARRMNRQKQLM